MATFFSGGTIWCGVGCVASSVRIDGAKIVEVNGLHMVSLVLIKITVR